jgi:hypothetical protein
VARGIAIDTDIPVRQKPNIDVWAESSMRRLCGSAQTGGALTAFGEKFQANGNKLP